MEQPGGIAIRPLQKVYTPTFWPVQRFVHVRDQDSGRGVALLLRHPGAVSCSQDGRLQAIALRNATRERAFGFLPIPATPAVGHERSSCAFEYALLFTAAGDWKENRLPSLARELAHSPWDTADDAPLRSEVASGIAVDSPDVWVTAAKPASRGEGIIVRLYAFAAPRSPVTLMVSGRPVQGSWLCDARERDLEPLPVRDGAAVLSMAGAIATVRLFL